ncbi:MAG: hypothetical protein WC279_12545 [Sulfurimonas sp.]|jgi:hypothetical protein|uniref:hypothetical protein n=1 Tax=Sulfurimonas sp. TaxID=2022749 RepID=UPI003565B271
MFRVKNNSTGKYLDPGHLQYYFLRSDGVLCRQMYQGHGRGVVLVDVSEKYTVEMLMINHCRGDLVMPLYENDRVYVAGHGNCIVRYSRDECVWYIEEIVTGREYLYQDIIEDIEKIIDPEEQEDQ